VIARQQAAYHIKEFSMKKTNRIKMFGITALAAVIVLAALGTASCMSVNSPVTPDQLGSIQLRSIQPGEAVKTLDIPAKSTLEVDLNTYEGGAWYAAHRDKIVSVARRMTGAGWLGSSEKWRVQYVD
jgi:hypothetical protein